MRRPAFALLVVAMFASSTAMAVVPAQITIQGKATDLGGTPLPAGSKSFVFRIFDSFQNGTEIWPGGPGDAQLISTDAAGLWTANVGASTALTEAVFSSDMRWIEVSIDGTILPRIRLITVPYAYRVGTVDGASGGSITTKVAIGPGTVASGANSFAAGELNSATGAWSTVSGGRSNEIIGDCGYGTIGGGYTNVIGESEGISRYGTIGGGSSNFIGSQFTQVDYGAIGGGYNNTVTASNGTIPGGVLNSAGFSSFACGNNAHADHDNSFVWCDGSAPISTANSNQFVARAANGYALHSSTGNTGCWLFASASAWSPISDSSMKENRQSVDGAELLQRLAAIPVETWNYIEQGDSIRHIGPMAQDFYSAFGVGESERHISTIDADGVALAAIQELAKQLKEKDEQIAALMARLTALEK